MVSTRRHPKEFPEPDLSPSRSRAAPSRKGQWAHTPSNLVLAWLMISLPLVMWDTGYVLLRPLSMPGGSLHWPLWVPYELYGRVDYIYGWKAFNAKNGFTSAQGTMNVVETVAYFYYLYILYAYGKQSTAAARGAPKSGIFSGGQRHVSGSMGGVAALIGFAVSVMTVSKTLLYWLNESFSGFDNIGHNSLLELIPLWIIPNGAWIVLPTYMAYVTGANILQGLAMASGGAVPSSDDTDLAKHE